MTEQELNIVHELKIKVDSAEKYLAALRRTAENLVPIIDGLPHSQNFESRVEKIALKIAEGDRELLTLQKTMAEKAIALADKIRSSDLTSQEQEILILRYVACMRFRDISFEKNLSDTRVYRVHAEARNKILKKYS